MPDFESFDGDEIFLLIASGVTCAYGLYYWAGRLQPVSKLGSHPWQRLPLYLATLTGLLVLGLVVAEWADPQIRENSGYVLLVFLMGGACLTIVSAVLPWLGISFREDAFEQRNFAAVLTLSGAILGVLITYAGANTGTGPSLWNNVFSSLVATGSLLLIWTFLAVAGRAAESVVEERDLASGWRLGLFLAAESLILGRAVAGNWLSIDATVQDFLRDGWPAAVLCLFAVVLERVLRPAIKNPQPLPVSHGIVPGCLFLVVALAWCAHLGVWKDFPK